MVDLRKIEEILNHSFKEDEISIDYINLKKNLDDVEKKTLELILNDEILKDILFDLIRMEKNN